MSDNKIISSNSEIQLSAYELANSKAYNIGDRNIIMMPTETKWQKWLSYLATSVLLIVSVVTLALNINTIEGRIEVLNTKSNQYIELYDKSISNKPIVDSTLKSVISINSLNEEIKPILESIKTTSSYYNNSIEGLKLWSNLYNYNNLLSKIIDVDKILNNKFYGGFMRLQTCDGSGVITSSINANINPTGIFFRKYGIYGWYKSQLKNNDFYEIIGEEELTHIFYNNQWRYTFNQTQIENNGENNNCVAYEISNMDSNSNTGPPFCYRAIHVVNNCIWFSDSIRISNITMVNNINRFK